VRTRIGSPPRRWLAALLAIASLTLQADVVIPSSVYRDGLNFALFESDVRIFNPTGSPVNVTPVFYDQTNGGAAVTKPFITIPPRTQVAYDNVLQSLFGLGKGPFGPIRFETSAPIVVSSSVNNQNGCGNGSVSGQWLPGIDAANALRSGTLVHLAASADPKTGYRTNLDFMNPGSDSTNVTVKIRRGDGTLLSSATLGVAANGLVQKAIDDPSFPGVAGTTDTNLWVEFTSDLPVLAFASVIANASGDPFAIVMTADPAVPPVASFGFSPASPLPGQSVTFTDSSSNSPATQLWSFGDGGTATSGTSVSHAYAAAGTYKAAHFVTNAAGASSQVKDVVVSSGATSTPTPTPTPTSGAAVQIQVVASQWDFNPRTVTLKVGTKYQITWTSSDVLHGVGGLALLGIVNCNAIPAQGSCSATITPKSSQVGTYGYACSQSSCGAGHNSMTGSIVVTN
jgi:PKD repeat protein